MKCNNLNNVDYKYLQRSNDPSFSISCYTEIFPFGTLTNKNFLFMMMVNSSPTAANNSDANNINTSSSLALKPAILFLLFNQFCLEQKMRLKMLIKTLNIMALTNFKL